MRAGFIGLGSQGAPMARRMADAGIPTTLWARRAESLDPFAECDVEIAGSPAELASASDVICVCVVDDAGVEQVLTADEGVLAGCRPGTLIVIHSTVHPETCRARISAGLRRWSLRHRCPSEWGRTSCDRGTVTRHGRRR